MRGQTLEAVSRDKQAYLTGDPAVIVLDGGTPKRLTPPADRFLLPFFWHDISIVLIEVQSHEDSKLGNEQRRF